MGNHPWNFFAIFLVLFLAVSTVAQECSATKPCADGCCSRWGFCGWGDDFCKDGCLNSCDAKKTCDANRPCATGCCSKFGFCGLGPDYCAEDVCVNNCDRKADCDPGGYGKDFVVSQSCPLNVCCSKFGFCGLTEEFCGDKKVKRPSCSVDSTKPFERVVGYYEEWSMDRYCNQFNPERIPAGVYTHLNYAFASIDPESFEIRSTSSRSPSLYRRLTDLKMKDPALKVFIAIGGWTFNDPGPTATTFSDIARSESNTRKFASSLLRFMATYGFDGVDLDWEYPGADDRSGRPEDFKNFPLFLARLKAALEPTGGGLSITIPASYWYLQHFDIKAIQSHIDFFNIMTYDLHGTWDKPNRWVGPYLNAHTNLTEIADGLDLLWRNNIEPSKVSLGLAFYGRGFTLTDPKCASPGCTYDSGSRAQKCSNEVSVVMNSEIIDIMSKGARPTLDKKAAVKMLTFDETQWVTFDDAETLQLKADFARSQCIGGIMVWAVSQDTKNSTFSQALGKAVQRKAQIGPPKIPEKMEARSPTKQCKWTGCGENCPAGYTLMAQEDPTHKKLYGNSWSPMSSWTGCDTLGNPRNFCCPNADELPTCGWYNENNGDCRPSCPKGTVEIGSSITECNIMGHGAYNAACCTTEAPGMKLYGQCDWTGCDDNSCSNTQLLVSSLGSGAGVCGDLLSSGSVPERKYCCDDDDNNTQWKNCETSTQCSNSCPDGKYLLSLDNGRLRGMNTCIGFVSQCCEGSYYKSIVPRENAQDAEFRDQMDAFLDHLDEYADQSECFIRDNLAGDIILPRDLSPFLVKKANSEFQDLHNAILNLFFGTTVSMGFIRIWDSTICVRFNSLCYASFYDYINADPDALIVRYSPLTLVTALICDPADMADIVGGKTNDCYCPTLNCCMSGDVLCEVALVAGDNRRRQNLAERHDGAVSRRRVISLLSERQGSRDNEWISKDGAFYGEIFPMDYDTIGQWDVWDDLLKHAYDFGAHDCSDVRPGERDIEDPTDRAPFATEHAGLELNTPKHFFPDAIAGTLPSGGRNIIGPIPGDFFTVTLTTDLRDLRNVYGQNVIVPPARGNTAEYWPMRRLMNALGSKTNRQVFTAMLQKMNIIKNHIWEAKAPVGEQQLTALVQNPATTTQALREIREVLVTMNYFNVPRVHNAMVAVLDEWRLQLRWAERLDQAINPGRHLKVYNAWDQWFQDFLTTREDNVRNFLAPFLADLDTLWQAQTGHPNQQRYLNDIAALTQANNFRFNRIGLFNHKPPV